MTIYKELNRISRQLDVLDTQRAARIARGTALANELIAGMRGRVGDEPITVDVPARRRTRKARKAKKAGRRAGFKMSKAARAKIGAAARKRWAAKRAEAKKEGK